MTTISALTPEFGAQVDGLDLSAPIDDDTLRMLANTLYEHRLLLIKSQDLSVEQYYQFGARWGSLITHVLDFLRVPGYPEMMAIGNTEKKDRDPKIRNGAAHWHTDGSYRDPPTSITMLYARLVPRVGGATLFCDMARAYDALSLQQQRLAESTVASHYFGAGVDDDEEPVAPFADEDVRTVAPPVKYSFVMAHPVTGRKALYGLGQSPYAIDGLDDEQMKQRLAQFKDHALQQQFIYEHRYEVGDIMLIDCLATMHCGTHIDVADRPDADNARLLWRLSTEGLPSVIA